MIGSAIHKFFDDGMPTYAAALAYRVIFALIPFLIFLTTLLGVLDLPILFDWMRSQAAYMLPTYAMRQLDVVLGEVQRPQRGLMSVSVLLALWSGSAGVISTINALNVAYDVKERRPAWKRFLLSIVYTTGLAATLIAAAALMVTGPHVLAGLGQYFGIRGAVVAAWAVLRWPAAIGLLLIAVSLIYYAAPNVKGRFRLVSIGSVIAVSAWIAASIAFNFYVQNFGQYGETYGSMGAIVVLLFYFYLSAAGLLFGAEINAVLAREAGAPLKEARA